MLIGFDAKRSIQNNTGLGNYSRYVIDILSRFYPENDYFLYAPKKKENQRLKDIQERKNVFFRFPDSCWKWFSSIWRSYGIKKELINDQIDVFHGLSNEIPFRIGRTGIQSVVSIHDLIFLRYPRFYKPVDRLIYSYKFRYACKVADKIIAVSECTKRDIISFFGISAEKITVIYQGCHSSFKQIVSPEMKKDVSLKYALPARFLLYVGTVEERKNLLLIVKAFKYINENIHLVVVGKKTRYQTIVANYATQQHLSHRVLFYPQASFEDLPALYQLAQIFILPSRYEGFGIPVIEALTSGTPVIAAKGSCLEEAGGENTIYIDPDNEMTLADAINLILNNAELAQQMSEEGKKYVERFSDKTIAKDLMQIYQKKNGIEKG
jgi:glycosyltransferase involved in cell wall biosynthesis